MLISKSVYTNEGNSVANYTEYVFKCERCDGQGWIYQQDGEDDNKEEECHKCHGEGVYTVRS